MQFEHRETTGTAFAMSNAINNSISVFAREDNGNLRFLGVEPTGGSGTGAASVDPLGSQGALIISKCGRFLFAANAADNTISSFRVWRGGIRLSSVIASGGVMPVSLSMHGRLLYACNVGNAQSPANVSGFNVGADGALSPIPGSTARLSAPEVAPSCVVFSPDGQMLVISEKATNRLTVFMVNPNGTLKCPIINDSKGETPFGMAFTPTGVLLVSEAGSNALSSYKLFPSGVLKVRSGPVPNYQSAICRVSVTPDGSHAYTSNAGNGTITLYHVSPDGALTLIESVPSTPAANGSPIGAQAARSGEALYVLNGGMGTISVFRIGASGHLTLIEVYQYTRLPTIGAQDIAVI